MYAGESQIYIRQVTEMTKENRQNLWLSLICLAAFMLWTALVCYVDVKPIGPQQSNVGFAALNDFVHRLTGTNMLLYYITDWLGLVPICVVLYFAACGLVQLIRTRSLWKVDHSILVLGVFYIVVMAVYILFEYIVINRRPVLIDGYLEPSYPSSTTQLVLCVMPTAIMQANRRIKHPVHKGILVFVIIVYIAFMLIGRLISGVHWLTDIIGGALLSAGLVALCRFFWNLQ